MDRIRLKNTGKSGGKETKDMYQIFLTEDDRKVVSSMIISKQLLTQLIKKGQEMLKE